MHTVVANPDIVRSLMHSKITAMHAFEWLPCLSLKLPCVSLKQHLLLLLHASHLQMCQDSSCMS